MRSLIFSVILGFAGQAFAGVAYQDFRYSADSRFTLSLSVNGEPVELKGYLRDGDKVTAKAGYVTAELTSYRTQLRPTSAVSIIVSVEGQDLSNLLLIDTSTQTQGLMSKEPIVDRKASIASDFEGILAKLMDPHGTHRWDVRTVFDSLVEYYDANPAKQLFQFYDRIELVTIPKPAAPSLNGHGSRMVQTPSVPTNVRPLDPQVLDGPQTADVPSSTRQASRQTPGQPLRIAPGGDDQDEDAVVNPPSRGQYQPQYGDEEVRRRSYEQSRRATEERERRRGRYQPGAYGGYGYGSDSQQDSGVPPEPQRQQANGRVQRPSTYRRVEPRQQTENSFVYGNGGGYPQPPQRGGPFDSIQRIFGN